VIDCIIREISDGCAAATVESAIGIPDKFTLILTGDDLPRACRLEDQSGNRIKISFEMSVRVPAKEAGTPRSFERGSEVMRSQLLELRYALDNVAFGIVLLDTELRATFINQAFRRMWKLPDAKADARPPFIALMYHGRDTRAYQVPPGSLSQYVAERVAHIKAGLPEPIDLRLSDGEVLRMQCAVLPNGGRMLCYTPVTDIVRHSDELEILRAALFRLQDGVILLDSDLRVQFMNASVRRLWGVSDEKADSKPHYSELVGDARHTGSYGVAPKELDNFIAQRVALVLAGDPSPQDLCTGDGRHVRSQCTILPSGGRMLTYCDVTDLINNAARLHELATTDSMTGLFNRRQFMALAEAEWTRFQRYHRPLSLLMVDIDHFKYINDTYGHAAGDLALSRVASLCNSEKRQSDVAGRIGGDEFALLLPETDSAQSVIVADRVRSAVAAELLFVQAVTLNVTVSIGISNATLSMASVSALMRSADEALYKAKSLGRNRAALSQPTYSAVGLAAE
jgi:diguanylate cyclase (GGDEF)-like protein